MQSESDAKRIRELGAPKDRIFITGNLKFDLGLKDKEDVRAGLRKKLGIKEQDMLLVCGSTGRGEEKVILDCFKALKNEYRNIKLLIAPRHIERSAEIEKLISKAGFKSARLSLLSPCSVPERSEWFGVQSSALPVPSKAEGSLETIFILDTIGELRSMYSASDIVFVGGSLIKRGGQNPIEPAGLARPIIFGKYTYNFQDVIRMLIEQDAGIEVQDKAGFYKAIKCLLDNSEKRNQMGSNAKIVVDKNSGSCQRTIVQILSNL